MKRMIFVVALLFAITPIGKAQITTSHAAAPVEKSTTIAVYDSTRNWIGNDNVASYKGQLLYVNGKSESLRGYGYDDFKTKKEPGTLSGRYGNPAASSSFNTKYEDLVGKYFTVLDVQPDSQQKTYPSLYGKVWWFLLQNRDDTTDTVWFRYSGEFQHSFPFITISYFNYLKSRIGTKYVVSYSIREDNTFVSRVNEHDFYTGELIKQSKTDRWECIDVTIEDKYFNLVLVVKNQNGDVSIINQYNLEELNGELFVFEEKEFNNLVAKYGAGNMDMVRQHKVRVGMPEKLVIMSWGTPDKINRSSYGPNQWVYDNQYVYIENGKVTAWN